MRFLISTPLIAILSTSAIAGLILWGLSWRIEEVTVAPVEEDKPPVVSRSIDLIGKQKGRPRWRLLSEQVQMEQGQQVFDQGAHGLFYGDPSEDAEGEIFFDKREQMQWEAGLARYNAAIDQLLLNENVEVLDADGSQLLTQALEVTPEEAIDVPAPFTLTDEAMMLAGESGSFNFKFAQMVAQQGQLVVLPDGSDPIGTPADASEASSILQTVAADPQSTVITANTLRYDRTSQVAEGTGNLVIQEKGLEIRSPNGLYNRKAGQSNLLGGVILQEKPSGSGDGVADELLADISLAQAQPTEEEQEVTIVADQLDYDRNTQIAQGQGNLEILQGETVIKAPQGSYRRQESQSILSGGVTLEEPRNNPTRVLKSVQLEGNHKDKVFLFEQDVIYTQLSETEAPTGEDASMTDELRRADTEVRASRLVYNSRTEVSEFSDNVEFIQKGRLAKSEEAIITPELVTLTGAVEIQQIDGDWLARRFQDPEAREDISRPTLIFADRVEIDQATSNARFYDNVVIVQKNRAVEGDTATFFDAEQTFEIASNSAPVMLCDRGEAEDVPENSVEGLPGRDALDVTCRGANEIQAQLVTLDMANDTYSASGDGKMTFRVGNEGL